MHEQTAALIGRITELAVRITAQGHYLAFFHHQAHTKRFEVSVYPSSTRWDPELTNEQINATCLMDEGLWYDKPWPGDSDTTALPQDQLQLIHGKLSRYLQGAA